MGGIILPKTLAGNDEIRLEVIGMQTPGAPIFTNLEVLRLAWRQRAPATLRKTSKESLSLAYGDAASGPQLQQGRSSLIPGMFRSPFIQQQQYMTPGWVKYPSFYDPCETEGIIHDAAMCGLTEADFAG